MASAVFCAVPSVMSEAKPTLKVVTVRVLVPLPAAELVIVPAELPAPKAATVALKPLRSKTPPVTVNVLLALNAEALPAVSVPALIVVGPA